ncbi:MAG TPA: FAD-binding oxidoreductase [Candidatus Limnocylindria bacterium]|nr:FAD-binding oxidoreductase [Candidatus Limnocylindria bacterium]
MSSALGIRGIEGRVIGPEDADYDAARATFYGGIDKRPSAVVRVANAEDVARTVSYARDAGIELAVRSGGHSATGLCLADRGVVVDLHDMRRVEIDPAARTVWAEAGITAVELARALDEHDLALSFGDTGSVGIGGLTTGGGVGYLVRKHGLTIDSLIAAEVVTADGKVRRVDARTEPDLFWAIRGGGGNFGVVTRFQYRAAPLGECFGGMFMIPATAEVIRRFIELSEQAPDELTTIANVMPAMPLPFVPADKHGALSIFALVLYAGPAAEGERVLAPLRSLAAPFVDMVKPMRYPEVYPPEDPSYHPIGDAHNMFLDRVDAPTAELIVREVSAPTTAMIHVAQIRVLGGAYAQVPVDATAYAHRRSKIMVNVGTAFTDPSTAAAERAWVARVGAALKQSDGGAYVNFLTHDGAARIRDAYPGKTYDRLREIKRRYDPTNLFHLNQNIAPA